MSGCSVVDQPARTIHEYFSRLSLPCCDKLIRGYIRPFTLAARVVFASEIVALVLVGRDQGLVGRRRALL
jgi:hypothetical protein